MGLFPRTQERVRNSRGRRAISVRATEVLLYHHPNWHKGQKKRHTPFYLSTSPVLSIWEKNIVLIPTYGHWKISSIMDQQHQRTNPHEIHNPGEIHQQYSGYMVDNHLSKILKNIQSNFNGLNTFGTMKISSRQG